MKVLAVSISALALAMTAPASAQELAPAVTQEQLQPANPQIDYAGFVKLATELAETRETHRLSVEDFLTKAREDGAILLDTRSAAAFAEGHLEGAINLPFSDFTSESLKQVLGEDQTRAIYIYCNNNFSDGVRPVVAKSAPLALNIPTFINLHGYGYTNVWEMAGVTTMQDINWVSAESNEPVTPLAVSQAAPQLEPQTEAE